MSLPTTGLLIWYKVDAGGACKDYAGTPCADGDVILQFRDQSGNNRHTTNPAYINRSRFRSTPAPTLGTSGLPMADFAVGGAGLQTGYSPAAPFTILCVYTGPVSGSHRAIDGSNNWLIGPFNGFNACYMGGFVSQNTSPAVVANTIYRTLTTNSGSVSTFSVDGVDYTTGGTNHSLPGTINFGAAGTQGQDLTGFLAEFAIWDHVLSPSEQSQALAYAARWHTAPVPVPGQITVLNGGSAGGASGATTVPADTRNANLIVLQVGSGAGAISVSDSLGNTWTPLTQYTDPNFNNISQLFYCASPKVGASHTFTVSGSGAFVAFLAVSGADTTPFEIERGGSGGSGTSGQPGRLMAAESGALCVAGIFNRTGVGTTVDSGYSILPNDWVSGGTYGGAMAWLVQPTAAAVNPTFTWTTSDYWASSGAIFEPVPVTPPSGVITVLKSGIGVANTARVDTTGANLIVLHVSWNTVGGPAVVSDNKGNTWVSLTPQSASIGSQLFYCANPIVGPGHTFATSSYLANIAFLAVSGVSTIPFEIETGKVISGLASFQPGSFTPAENGALCIAGFGLDGPTSATVDSGYSLQFFPHGATYSGALAWLVQSVAAPVNPTFTVSPMGYGGLTAAVFKPAPVVVPPPVVVQPPSRRVLALAERLRTDKNYSYQLDLLWYKLDPSVVTDLQKKSTGDPNPEQGQ